MTSLHSDTIELLHPNLYSEYLLHGQREMEQILNGLLDKHALVTVYVRDNNFMSAILAVDADEGHVVLDACAEDRLNQMVIGSAKSVASTLLDRVKIQFPIRNAMPWRVNGRLGLRANFPDMMLRLQRRAFFRLVAPTSHNLTCVLPIIDRTGKIYQHSARVLDISGGGIGMLVPPKEIEFSQGMYIENCTLELPDSGVISFTLHVRSVFQVNNRTGGTMDRAGCEFVGLSNQATNLIQRYILRVERERKAKEMGL
jgi:flagellar brake protein